MLSVAQLFVVKKFALSSALGLAVLSLVACQPVTPTTSAPAEAPAAVEATSEATEEAGASAAVVAVNVSAAGIDMPAEVPSGIVTFALQMAEDAPGVPEFARLNDGVTMDQLMAALQEDEMAAIAMVRLLGSSDAAVDGQITYELSPGNYIGLAFPEEGQPSIATFTAGESNGAAEPQAGATAQMDDFAFIMPDEIAAGPQTWLIENVGEQWHEMAVVKLAEGATVEDVMAAIMSEEESSEPPPFEFVAGISPMGAGQRTWVTWDLPAGEYTVICFLPDMAGDMAPHATHGMVRTLFVK